MASLYKEALKNAQKQQDDFRKAIENSKSKNKPQELPRNDKTRAKAKDRNQPSHGRKNSSTTDERQTVKTLPRADESIADTAKFVGQGLLSGLAGFNRGVAQTADFLLPDFLTPNFVQKGIDYYKNAGDEEEKKLQEMQTTKGKEIAGTLISGTVQALPNAALALMSGGASLGAQGAAIGAETATGINALTGAAARTVKNPAFWTSFAQTAGPTYEKEIEQGASEGKATASALANALLGSAIELGGGIEKFNPNQGVLKSILRTAAEEGSEEIK